MTHDEVCEEIAKILDRNTPEAGFPTPAQYKDMATSFAALMASAPASESPLLAALANGADGWNHALGTDVETLGLESVTIRVAASRAFNAALTKWHNGCEHDHY